MFMFSKFVKYPHKFITLKWMFCKKPCNTLGLYTGIYGKTNFLNPFHGLLVSRWFPRVPTSSYT